MWFNTASNKQQATRHIFMAAQPTRPKVPPEIRVFNMALLEENNGYCALIRPGVDSLGGVG